MKYFQIAAFCLICLFNTGVNGNPTSSDDLDVGYYWRQYTRDIPEDALPGGVDKRGKITYIGQTLHSGCLTGVIVTGQIQEAEKRMTYEWGYQEHVAKNPVQILCSRHIERYGWIKTNSKDIVKLSNKHLVSGGVEKNYTVYIGRVTADGEVAVGKVLVTNMTGLEGLYTTLNGKYLHVLNSFDVLSYDPSIPREKRMHAAKLTSPNSCVTNSIWQPILIFTVLHTLYYSVK